MTYLLLHPIVFVTDKVQYFTVFFVHFGKQVDDPHIEIDQAVVRHVISPCRIIGSRKCAGIAGKEKAHTACLLIITNEVKHIEVFFAGRFAESSSELLQEDHRRLGRPQEHDHINSSYVYSLVEHVHTEDHTNLSGFQLLNGDIPLFGNSPSALL